MSKYKVKIEGRTFTGKERDEVLIDLLRDRLVGPVNDYWDKNVEKCSWLKERILHILNMWEISPYWQLEREEDE